MNKIKTCWHGIALSVCFIILISFVQDCIAQSHDRTYKRRDPEGKIRLLYLGGGEWHDYLATAAVLRWDLEMQDKFYMTYTEDQDILTRLDGYDAVLLNHMHTEMTDVQEGSLLEAVRNGMPLVVLHATTAAYTKPGNKRRAFHSMVGTDGVQPKHPRIGTFRVHITDTGHAVTSGVNDFDIFDELFLLGNHTLQPDVHVLLTAKHEDKTHPLAWTRMHGKGRVLYMALGHGTDAMNNDTMKQLVRQGLHWALEQ